MVRTALVIGNPKAHSRTRAMGEFVARELFGNGVDHVVDVADLGAQLLDPDSSDVDDAIAHICGATHVLIGSPTYKATYTGVLKVLLDRIPADGLANATAFPFMVGASSSHALAPEFTLKPVLVELGAHCPAPGLFVLQQDEPDMTPTLAKWLARARPFGPMS